MSKIKTLQNYVMKHLGFYSLFFNFPFSTYFTSMFFSLQVKGHFISSSLKLSFWSNTKPMFCWNCYYLVYYEAKRWLMTKEIIFCYNCWAFITFTRAHNAIPRERDFIFPIYPLSNEKQQSGLRLQWSERSFVCAVDLHFNFNRWDVGEENS